MIPTGVGLGRLSQILISSELFETARSVLSRVRLPGNGMASPRNPVHDLVQFFGIKPNAMVTTNVDDHSAPPRVLLSVHDGAALCARSPELARMRTQLRRLRRAFHQIGHVSCFRHGPLANFLKGVVADPQTGADLTLAGGDFLLTQLSRVQFDFVSTLWTGPRTGFASQCLGRQRVAALIAELGAIADARHAIGADRVEISLVNGEIGVTETAGGGVFNTRCAAVRATHNLALASLRFRDHHDLTAIATDACPHLEFGDVIPVFALGASKKDAHGLGLRQVTVVIL